uniref:Coat protein n=1 Tax=Xiangshan martelli-like virus 2 TaxID=2886233 RepID=A0A8K1P3J5_9VIRU|nr:MAG: coat protein [Xiangshan martelli-like virus 2]
MSYTNYTTRHMLLAKQAWCTFDDMIRFVRQHQHSGFHVKACRTAVLEAYNRLGGDAPFSRTVRFPDDIYVHLDNDVLSGYLSQIMAAIDLPDRQIERSVGSTVEYGINSLSDAKRSYDVAFARLAASLRAINLKKLSEVGVYDRENFEAAFELTWV